MATTVEAPMVGKILKIEKQVGDHVEEDDVVIVMEAMKMEIPVVAPVSGTVKEITSLLVNRSKPSKSSQSSNNPAVLFAVNFRRSSKMDTWTFGWTLALIGMGGTMLVLWLLSLLILLIKKVFPYQPDESTAKKG